MAPNTATSLPSSARANSSSAAGSGEDPSRGRTLRFQDSLPTLPVPSLQETATRYLQSVVPLVAPEEHARTHAAVLDFIRPGGVGEALQQKLLARRADPAVKNWLSDWWNHSAYLGYRDSVVPYVSYFYSYRDDRRFGPRNPARRAAQIAAAALAFRDQLVANTLEPEYARGAPLCMHSYRYMFNCCRIPALPADYPQKYDYHRHQHIAVVRKNQFFAVPHVVDRVPLTAAELERQFRRVYELADASPTPPAVGALTSEHRDTWAQARKLLLESPANAQALEAIESASFVVCLDDSAPVTLEERAHTFWHGDGRSRFYDKPLQFVVCDNAAAGFMGEHSMMDGTPTLRLNDFVCDAAANDRLPLDWATVRSRLADPTALRFDIAHGSDLLAMIDAAQRRFGDVIGAHDLRVLQFLGYGKDLIKSFGCSPDAFVQMIIQLAYFKMYGKSRPTYESAATRKFLLGRTETCRSLSACSVAWCKAMSDPDAPADKCVALLRAAIDAHVEYLTAASDGRGVDRHLFGLKQLLEPGQPLPELYADPTYAYSSSWYLSTSQLNSEYFNGYGWSQVIDQGFGIAYMVNARALQFNIVSKRLGADKMHFYLTEAANEMRALMETEAARKADDKPKAKL